MTPEQLQQIEQARRYAEQDEYAVTRAHIRNLLAIIEGPRFVMQHYRRAGDAENPICAHCGSRAHFGMCAGSPT